MLIFKLITLSYLFFFVLDILIKYKNYFIKYNYILNFSSIRNSNYPSWY